MSAATDLPPRKLSPIKWIAGVLSFVVVIGGSMALGLYLRGGPPQPAAAAPSPIAGAILFILGLVVFLAGAGLYGLTLLTGCFTLDFTKPFFSAFGKKLWFLNVIVGLLLQAGFAFMLMPFVYPLVVSLGVPPQLGLMLSMFGPFILAQLLMVWINIWGPLEPIVVRRRMRGRGIPDAQIDAGRIIGTSDPTRSSLRRLGLVEDDFGILWIGEDRLFYWGDIAAWEIPHDKLLAVERKANAGSVSSYFGAVHVILRFLDAAGAERTIRLHSEGDLTQTGKARGLDRIADRLNAWMQRPLAGWVDRPAGFAVAGIE